MRCNFSSASLVEYFMFIIVMSLLLKSMYSTRIVSFNNVCKTTISII